MTEYANFDTMLYIELVKRFSSKDRKMTAHDYRNLAITAKQKWGRGEITMDEMCAAFDSYINAIKEFKERTKNKKLRVPDRGYLIRALS